MLDYETVIGTEGSSFTAALTICHCVHERSENGDLKFNVQYSDKLYIAKGFFWCSSSSKSNIVYCNAQSNTTTLSEKADS